MKRWNVLRQITGMALCVFILVSCSRGNSPTSVSMPIKESLTPTPIPLPALRPVPVPTLTGSTGIPVPGQWQANGNESGPFEFTVSSDRTAIIEIHYHISNFTCASVTTSMNSDISAFWSISNGQFTLDTAPNNPLDVIISGAFDRTGRHATGNWKIIVFGQSCPSVWTGDSTA